MGAHAIHPALRAFSKPVQDWFTRTYRSPTAVQALVWPEVAQGSNVLATAPTGCGKTLAAFLWAIDRFASGTWPRAGVQVLYVSPLKALNNDIRTNLLTPLRQLGLDLEVGIRSGDTPQAERQRQRKKPPDILITTPESLNLLLTSKGGRSLFGALKLVIVDEIHAVAGSKRGTHMMSAIERLVPLSGEFQRVALSATVHPLERVATWFAGHQIRQVQPLLTEPRALVTVKAPDGKHSTLRVVGIPKGPLVPSLVDEEGASPDIEGDDVWRGIATLALERIEHNRSTLIFGSGRRAVEKITRFINSASTEQIDVAYCHHGSLSKEVRAVVEERLKAGKLKAIVATSSLELGIDIGEIDEVIQVQAPFSVASLVQRMGRAGHQVGETSRALLVPLFERDVLSAAVIAKAALEGELEPTIPLVGGLDILAQIILSMTATESWKLDHLYATIRSCHAYHLLTFEDFLEVLEMLSGRYDGARFRSLEARLLWDKADGTLKAKRGVDLLVYGSGGTIADRGYYQLRLADTKAKLGELDEEFVWERSIGDRFTLGNSAWQIEQIGHNDVLVRPTKTGGAMIPFWRAEDRDRDAFLAEKIASFLEQSEEFLSEGRESDLREWLQKEYPLEREAVDNLVTLLRDQRKKARAPLPHRTHLLIEYYRAPDNNQERRQVVLHTFWGGKVNRPFAMAIKATWERKHKTPLVVMHTDDCVVLALSDGFTAEDILRPLRSDRLQQQLKEELSRSGLFGARFRENAGCSLLLPRGDFRRRLPLWLNRMRAKKLMGAVSQYERFPITLETWRVCLQESFDLQTLQLRLDDLAEQRISISESFTDSPSPFAKEVVWKHTNTEMYQSDSPQEGASSPGDDWLRQVTLSSSLRPRIDGSLSQQLKQKLQRTFPGYAPRGTDELLAWLNDRVLVPEDEWNELLTLAGQDDAQELVAISATKLKARTQWIQPAQTRLLSSNETLDRLRTLRTLGEGEEDRATEEGDEELRQALREWLRFYPPISLDFVKGVWGFSEARLKRLLEPLNEADEVTVGQLHLDATEDEVCDTQNLETLLRWTRNQNRSELSPLPLQKLGLFWAQHQGVLSERIGTAEGLADTLAQFTTLAAPAALWEQEIFPARLRPYQSSWLDALFSEDELMWIGRGSEKLTFVVPDDLLLLPDLTDTPEGPTIPPFEGRQRVDELALSMQKSSTEVAAALWQLAWAGQVTNDGFASVRQGLQRRFKGQSETPQKGMTRSRRRLGRQRSRPYAGLWSRTPDLAKEEAQLDSLDKIERNKERARILLDRYGVLFRQVVAREPHGYSWSDIFSALRLMELSGEVSSGHYFEEILGLQFATPHAIKALSKPLPHDAIYWLSALDPACPTGLGLGASLSDLPPRRLGNHVVARGDQSVIVSTGGGKELTIQLALDEPQWQDYFSFLQVALHRSCAPQARIEIFTINGASSTKSPWRAKLAEIFDLSSSPRSITLQRRHGA